MSECSSPCSIQLGDQVDAEQTSQNPKDSIVEDITPDVYYKGADSSRDSFSGIWSRTLRIKITCTDGFEKLNLWGPVSDQTSNSPGATYLVLRNFFVTPKR